MKLNFNSQGYLHQTIELTYEEFKHHFATNLRRKWQIENAQAFFRIFHSCGCQTVYVDGSFASTKKEPEDIDLCFDLNAVDDEKIMEVFPEFFDLNEIGRIRRNLLCHILYFRKNDTFLFDMLKEDRAGNLKGMIKLNLTELIPHL